VSSVVLGMDASGFHGRTDVNVVIDPVARSCIWVPRDLWSPCTAERINVAFKKGSHALVRAALKEHGLAVDHSLCFSRVAIERCLEHVRVTVPVPVRMEFDYPLRPGAPIEEGSKRIEFTPPEEHLSRERIHQWIGARSAPEGQWRGGDLDRIDRQKTFVRCILEQNADLSPVFNDPALYDCTNLDFVVDELEQVTPEWSLRMFYPMLCRRVVDGKDVLVNPSCT